MTTTNDPRPAGVRTGANKRATGDTTSVLEATITAGPFDREAWRSAVEDVILRLAESGAEFSADDVRAAGVGEPAHPNAWGPVFAAMHGRHLIERVGYAPSGRRARRTGSAYTWRGAPPRPGAGRGGAR